MLRLSDGTILPIDDYMITEKFDGVTQLNFDLPDSIYLCNEESIIDTESKQSFLVKVINGDSITCELDLDELRATQSDFDNGSKTPVGTAEQALSGTGWAVVDQTGITTKRTIKGALTPLDVMQQISLTWDGATMLYNNNLRTVTLVRPAGNQPGITFLTEALNLRQLDIAGDSSGFCTRLRAKGADGLSFASINGGKDYVENHTYSTRIIYGTPIEDSRFTDPQSLKDYAQALLDANAIPAVSYSCDVIDLAAVDNEEYNFLTLEMHKAVWLLDRRRKTKVAHRVVQYERHPLRPELNKVTLSTATQSIQGSVRQLRQALSDPNSPNRQLQAAAIDNATGWITGNKGGYVIIRKNDDGQAEEILIMDTPDIANATEVWRWNKSGLGYSASGYNGPYTTAITQDGAIVADFITTGTLTANLIKTGVLSSLNGATTINMETGVANLTGSLSTTEVTSEDKSISVGISPQGLSLNINGAIFGGMRFQVQEGNNWVDATCTNINLIDYNGNVIGWIYPMLLNGEAQPTCIMRQYNFANPNGGQTTGYRMAADGTISLYTNTLTVGGHDAGWLSFDDSAGNTFHVLGYY